MMRLDTSDGSRFVTGRLAEGAVAYLDADWLPPSSASIAALVINGAGSIYWSSAPSDAVQVGVPPTHAVALMLGMLARQAVEAIGNVDVDHLRVEGRGLVASWVRRHVGIDAGRMHFEHPPRAIVHTSVDPVRIEAAVRALDDLGLLVLAAATGPARMALDLYPHVHARGLRIIGLNPLTELRSRVDDHPLVDEALVREVQEEQTTVQFGAPLPNSLIYKIQS